MLPLEGALGVQKGRRLDFLSYGPVQETPKRSTRTWVQSRSHVGGYSIPKSTVSCLFSFSTINLMIQVITEFTNDRMSLSNEKDDINLRLSSLSVINNTCLAVTTCAAVSKYRTIDGSCNNLITTNLGKSFTDYRRFTTPAYADGTFCFMPM